MFAFFYWFWAGLQDNCLLKKNSLVLQRAEWSLSCLHRWLCARTLLFRTWSEERSCVSTWTCHTFTLHCSHHCHHPCSMLWVSSGWRLPTSPPSSVQWPRVSYKRVVFTQVEQLVLYVYLNTQKERFFSEFSEFSFSRWRSEKAGQAAGL